MPSGNLDAGTAILLDYINAMVNFCGLDEATGSSQKSLIRMLGPTGCGNATFSASSATYGVCGATVQMHGLAKPTSGGCASSARLSIRQ